MDPREECNMAMWVCRAGRQGEFENKFLEENRIYCTWTQLPVSLSSFSSKQNVQQYFVDQDPDIKIKTAINWASQVWPFAHQMKQGEYVILPSKIKSTIYVGRITGEYEFYPDNPPLYRHAVFLIRISCIPLVLL